MHRLLCIYLNEFRERVEMDFNPYNMKKLQDLMNKNGEFFDTFFGKSPFNKNFFEKVIENGNIVDEDEKAGENEGHMSQANVSNGRDIPMDIIQSKNEILIVFEIPGITGKEDVNIKILGSSLIIDGEIKRDYTLSHHDKTKFGRRMGEFYKKVHLPAIVDTKRIRARYKKGLLEIRIPTLRQSNNERISVQFPQD